MGTKNTYRLQCVQLHALLDHEYMHQGPLCDGCAVHGSVVGLAVLCALLWARLLAVQSQNVNDKTLQGQYAQVLLWWSKLE